MNIDELSLIWLRQTVPAAPSEKKLLAGAATVRRKIFFKQGLAAVLLIGTLVFLNVLVFPGRSQLVTTRIGISLVNLALLVYLAASGDVIYLWLKRIKQDIAVNKCLEEMLLLKKRQQFLCGKLLGTYFILLFSGLLLSMLEYTSSMRLTYALIAYGLTIAWALFGWFYLRPRAVEKYNAPLNRIIEEMERVAGQFGVIS